MVTLMSHGDDGIVCYDHRSATSRKSPGPGFAAIPSARFNAVGVVVVVNTSPRSKKNELNFNTAAQNNL